MDVKQKEEYERTEGGELRNLHAPDETESEANAFRQSEVWSTSDDHSADKKHILGSLA